TPPPLQVPNSLLDQQPEPSFSVDFRVTWALISNTMNIEAGKRYVLINARSGTAIQLSGSDNDSAGIPTVVKWELLQEDKHYILRNVHNGKYLGIDGDPHDKVPVRGVDAPVKWNIFPVDREQTFFQIIVPDTRLAVDLFHHHIPENGYPITIERKWEPGRNQCWTFAEGE
ncbi:hypothetical protein H0H93_004133, partial [Arthromyces matolae]